MRIIPALICITIHELAHGFTAYKLGDNTAKNMGRLTLNPIKHIDPVGMLMILFVGFGWAKPVPVDMRNFKHPKWYMGLTALAGPVSNIILAVIVILILGLISSTLGVFIDFSGDVMHYTNETGLAIGIMIKNAITLSIALAIFNMLPIPPLDGSKVLFSLLPEKAYMKLMRYERFGMYALLAIIISQYFIGISIIYLIIGRPIEVIIGWLSPLYEFAVRLVI